MRDPSNGAAPGGGRLLVVVCLAALAATPVFGETNQASGDIGGDGSLLIDSNVVTLNSVTLDLVKQARDLTGTVLPNGSDVVSGQEIYFVLHVDNTTSFPAVDVQLTDLIDEAQFAYVAGSLEQTTVASGSNDAAIWAGTWTAMTDVGADDDASATDTGGPASADRITVGAVAAQPNQSVTISGPSLKAFRFRVTVN